MTAWKYAQRYAVFQYSGTIAVVVVVAPDFAIRYEELAVWGNAMIMRVLRAKVKAGKLKDYQRLCEEKSFPHLRATPGLVALHMGAPLVSQPDEFVVVTVWRDLDALVGFAGEQWREVVVLPGEAELVDEMIVEHYDDSLRALGDGWRVSFRDAWR